MIVSLMAGIFSLVMLVCMIVAVGLASYYFGKMHRDSEAEPRPEARVEPVLAEAAPPSPQPELFAAIESLLELQSRRQEDQELAKAIASIKRARAQSLSAPLPDEAPAPANPTVLERAPEIAPQA